MLARMQVDLFTPTLAQRAVGVAPGATRLDIRTAICRLESWLWAQDNKILPKDLPTEHVFAPGVYLRTVYMLKGEVWIGKIHKHAHGNIISQGKVSLITEFGPEEREAHDQFVSPAGTKRAIVVLEDTIWTCVHANPDNVQDLDKLEEMFIVKSHAELGWEDPVPALELEGAA